MQVTVLIHLDLADSDSGPEFVWWAESPQIDGFSAAADHLPDLLAECDLAVPEILRDRGEHDFEIVHRLTSEEVADAGSPEEVSDERAVRVLRVA